MTKEQLLSRFNQWYVEGNGEYLSNYNMSQILDFFYAQFYPEKNHEADSQICQCGHSHNDHAIKTSPNYTAGPCKNCNCQNFLIKTDNQWKDN